MPVGEIANISIAQAFEVTIRRKQRGFKHDVIGCNTFEAAYDIRVQIPAGGHLTVSSWVRVKQKGQAPLPLI